MKCVTVCEFMDNFWIPQLKNCAHHKSLVELLWKKETAKDWLRLSSPEVSLWHIQEQQGHAEAAKEEPPLQVQSAHCGGGRVCHIRESLVNFKNKDGVKKCQFDTQSLTMIGKRPLMLLIKMFFVLLVHSPEDEAITRISWTLRLQLQHHCQWRCVIGGWTTMWSVRVASCFAQRDRLPNIAWIVVIAVPQRASAVNWASAHLLLFYHNSVQWHLQKCEVKKHHR